MGLHVESLVKLGRGVTTWSTGDRIPNWCYNVVFEVIEVVQNRVVIGNHRPPNGGSITRGVTGAVFINYVIFC
jgi:hypothetical protein